MQRQTSSPTGSADISAVVLAAGKGSRFDPSGVRYKLLQSLPDGRLVIQAVCETVQAAAGNVTVVCAHHKHEIETALSNMHPDIVHCPNADAGMGASIRCGVGTRTPALGWLIMLGDLPYVNRSTVDLVLQQLRLGALITRPFFNGSPGHPVAFSALLAAELRECDPRTGLQALIKRHASQLRWVDVNDEGCIKDIDVPGDLIC